MSLWRKIVYPILGLLLLAMFGLSLYELYVAEAGPDVSTYIGVPEDTGALPPEDYYGAYIRLKPGADSRFPSNLVQLLETTQAGVVSDDRLPYFAAQAIDAILVSQVTIDQDATQYRVYAVGQDATQETTALRLGGGRVLRIQPKSGLWAAGSYIVDVPSGGMFDTSRLYYAFGVK